MLPVLGCTTPQQRRIQKQGWFGLSTRTTNALGLCRLSAGSQSKRLAVETSGGFVI